MSLSSEELVKLRKEIYKALHFPEVRKRMMNYIDKLDKELLERNVGK